MYPRISRTCYGVKQIMHVKPPPLIVGRYCAYHILSLVVQLTIDVVLGSIGTHVTWGLGKLIHLESLIIWDQLQMLRCLVLYEKRLSRNTRKKENLGSRTM